MLISEKIDFKTLGNPDTAQLYLVFIHGWSGNKNSFERVAQSFDIRNSVWY